MRYYSAIGAVIFILALGCARPAAEVSAPQPAPAVTRAPSGAAPSAQARFDKMVADAAREGRLVIYSALAPGPRQAVADALKARFGLEVETVSGSGSLLVARVEAERRAGIYAGDIILAGATTQSLYKEKGFLAPMDRVLALPEVTDPKKWMAGALPFLDEERMMISYFIHAGSSIVINTELVKPDELKSYRDLLAPKWKDKILMQDPSVTGAGNIFFTINLMEIMGKDFTLQLAQQNPVVMRDRRLMLEWVARGRNPIVLAPDTSMLGELTRAGAPLKHIVPREGTYAGGGGGGLAMLNQAAHPEAAALAVNWVLSREGQTVLARAQPDQSRRLDVPVDFIDPDRRLDPNVKYIDSDAEKYLSGRMEMMKLAREMYGHLMK